MPEWFPTLPPNYWKNMNNKRKFLERMKRKFEIEKPEDWGKVTIWKITRAGGRALLKINKNSLFMTLKSVYPGNRYIFLN